MWLKNVRCLWVGIISLLILQAGCIKEELENCSKTTNLYITVHTEEKQPAAGSVENAILYLFDRNRTYIRQIELSDKEISGKLPVPVSYNFDNIPCVVVWSNIGERTRLPEFIPGTAMEQLMLSLKEDSDGHFQYPDNLFYGIKQLSGQEMEEVIVSPRTGRVNITVKGLPDEEKEEDSYYFSARSHYSAYDFAGSPVAAKCRIKLPAVFNTEQDLMTPQAYSLVHYPQYENRVDKKNNETLILELYRKTAGWDKDSLIISIEKDIEGKYLVPQPGKTINVLVYFKQDGTAEITVRITSWDEIYQWTEW